ncbi:thermonuclease family protein [Candidatus Daviesbacteria bacterium]|nr:thermonuclease family protein [Candidatus Daviesbacteria bacterium]
MRLRKLGNIPTLIVLVAVISALAMLILPQSPYRIFNRYQVEQQLKRLQIELDETSKKLEQATSSATPVFTKEFVKVTKVIDGDTIEIEGGYHVRYIGIDTPETVHPSKPVQCFGKEASNKNKELVEGKIVRLEKDITEIDRYGRLLRYIWIDDTLVNEVLVKEGYANSYTYPPDVKYQDRFIKAEREARESKKGLWASCPVS